VRRLRIRQEFIQSVKLRYDKIHKIPKACFFSLYWAVKLILLKYIIRKTNYLSLICLCIISSYFVQAQKPVYTFSSIVPPPIDSFKGNGLPAFDSLRVLYVFTRFRDEEEIQPGIPEWPVERVKAPEYAYRWLAQNPADMPNGSMSHYFYEASLGRFIYYGDIYPEVITLDSAILYYHQNGGYAAVSTEVIRKMNASGKVQWHLYDRWTHKSKKWTPEPDKMIDHIALILRTSPAQINPQCAWLGSGGGIASLHGGLSYVQDSFYVHGGSLMSGLIVNGGGIGNPDETMKTLKHETAHFLTLYHYSATNDQNGGPDLVSHGGWGMASASGSSSICVNSWDRDYLGWANFSRTFDPETDTACTIHLYDFLTTGAAVRIKIPHTDNQWFLLEYHANKGYFDRVDQEQTGLFITHQTNLNGPHHLDVEEADGRYDYELGEQTDTRCCGRHWRTIKRQPNPLLGYGDRDVMQLDKDGNNYLDRNDATAVPVFMVDQDGEDEIIHYLGDGGDAFTPRPGRNIFAIYTNPSTASNGTWLRNPVSHLNGIYIQVKAMSDSNLTFDLEFKNFNIYRSVRWCGNIEAHDSLTLKRGISLLLDKSRTFIRSRDTFPGAHFTLRPGAVLNLEQGSKITIQAGCSLTLEAGSKIYLNKGSEILVKRGGKIIYHPRQIVYLDKRTKITNLNPE